MGLGQTRKIIGWSSAVLVVFCLGMVAHGFWETMAMRDRPWRLETTVDILASDCSSGPEAHVFSFVTTTLLAQIADAKQCLQQTDETWAIRRDYTPCHQQLLRAGLNAWSIRLRRELRQRDQEIRLSRLLNSLEIELQEAVRARAGGTRFEVRHAAQSQARILADQARRLVELGRAESAFIAVLRARAAWGQSESFRAGELARLNDPAQMRQWEKQAQDLLRWTKQNGRTAILVDKLQHRCFLLDKGRVAKSYAANLGRNWFRGKIQENDASTPEGEYRILRKFRSANFGWALLLDYPNAADRARFSFMKRAGQLEARARIGGNIEIHGGGRRNSDWTDGCVSLENADMEDLYRHAYVGMRVTIVGTSILGRAEKE